MTVSSLYELLWRSTNQVPGMLQEALDRWLKLQITLLVPPCPKSNEYLGIRALIRCCAVKRAQHLGQNGRFTQQPPRGWLRAAQHAFFGAQRFSPHAKKNVARLFPVLFF